MSNAGADARGKVVSVNVGQPREVTWKGRTVRTGIFKSPVEGRVRVRHANLEGDGQADLQVHGGEDKAVYAYPGEHYPFWRGEYPGKDLPPGAFGENLTTEGLDEASLHLGDRLQCGSALLRVTQPRLPCYKLWLRFGRASIVKRFLESGRSGFYLAVEEEGDVGAGDPFERIETDRDAPTVRLVADLFHDRRADPEMLRRIVEYPRLPGLLRDHFEKLLARARTGGSSAR